MVEQPNAAVAGDVPPQAQETEMTPVVAKEDEADKDTAVVPVEGEGEGEGEAEAEAEGARRWYNHGQSYVTYEEFRETPMGVDILGGPEPFDAEQEVQAKWKTLQTEEVHRKLGGHYDLQEMENFEKPWSKMTVLEKIESASVSVIKFCAIWGVLYLFIISLGIMGDAFKILGGRSSGKAFRDSALLANPVAGLAIGILATVLMQSSSTTTSIVISMAAADLVTIKNAAYLIMGANIGTSVTNTLVSIAHLNSAAEYRRAFTGAVFHDMFNWLTVGMFLPLEASSGFLVELATAAVDSLGISDDSEKRGKVEFIKKITKPATGRIVSTDKKLIEKIAAAETSEEVSKLEKKTIIKQSSGHVLRDTAITDNEAGVLLLFASLTMLATCLLLLVKLLQSVLKGRVAVWTRYLLNIEFKNPILRSCGGFDNYILLLFGTGCTILVQSSSVFTSTLTPLVGIGLIHIEKAVALTHGANIGTTVTGVLSALSGSNVHKGMRVALEHVFFNCLGTVVWFVIWPLRPVPLNMAKFLGGTAANLRWFPIAYILAGFVGFPLLIIALSIPGWQVLCGVMTPIVAICLLFTTWVLLRRNRADLLPRSMPFLRADTLCGFQLPNFMLLWGGDVDHDAVNVQELQEKEALRKAREAATRDWAYSPAAWGLVIMAFVGAVICIPTTQWRRIRYASEDVGRDEIGLGLWEVCSGAYESDHKLMTAPTKACTYTDLVHDCAAELRTTCETDSTWATTEAQTKSEKLAYERAFLACSELGCRALAWENACKEMGSVCKGAYHADWCSAVLDEYTFFHQVNQDDNGVVLHYGEATDGVVVPDVLSHQSGFYSEAPEEEDDEASTNSFTVLSTANAALGDSVIPSLAGLAYDVETGFVHAVSSRGCNSNNSFSAQHLTLALDHSFTSEVTTKTVGVRATTDIGVDSPNAAGQGFALSNVCTGTAEVPTTTTVDGYAMGDMDILNRTGGVFIGAEQYGPKVVVWNAAGVLATYVPANLAADGTYSNASGTVFGVLPDIFSQRGAGRGLKTLAVNGDKTLVVVCMASALTHDNTTLASSRVTRCAMLNVTYGYDKPALEFQKVVVLQDAGADQATVQLTGATWTSDMKVLFLEKRGEAENATARVVEVDFTKGTDIAQNGTYNDMTTGTNGHAAGLANLEEKVVGTDGLPSVATLRTLFEMEVYPAPMKLLQTVPSDFPASSLAGLVAVNDFTLVMSEEGADTMKVWVLQVEYDVDLSLDRESLPSTSVSKFVKGDKCRDISEVCPVGGLEGDMEAIGGLTITGTLFLGIGMVMITTYSLWTDSAVFGKLLIPSGAVLTLAWVLLLAAWTHVMALSENEYGCYFQDEAMRGGMVLTVGKLKYLTMASYSWAFCIYAWGLLTISIIVIWAHVVSRCVNPEAHNKAPVDGEAEAAVDANKEDNNKNGETNKEPADL